MLNIIRLIIFAPRFYQFWQGGGLEYIVVFHLKDQKMHWFIDKTVIVDNVFF